MCFAPIWYVIFDINIPWLTSAEFFGLEKILDQSSDFLESLPYNNTLYIKTAI